MNSSRCLWAATTAVVLALTGMTRPAGACGGFFSRTVDADVAVMTDVRVAFVKTSGWVDQFVQVGFSGNVKNFAWVYPVAANPEVEEATPNPFPTLDDATRPRITIATPSQDSGGYSCLAGNAASDNSKGGTSYDPKVRLWKSGKVGAFDYVVITSTSEAALVTWLNKNGFAVPTTATPVLKHYVSVGWFFVAMKVSISEKAGDVPATTVVRLGYAANDVRYPLKMVSLSPAKSTSFEFYLIDTASNKELAPQAPYSAVNLNRSKVVATSESTHNYASVFSSTLTTAGPRGLVREYSSSEWPYYKFSFRNVKQGAVLTRLRGTVTPTAMDQDLIFVEKSHAKVSNRYDLVYSKGSTTPDAGVADASTKTGAVPPVALLLLLGYAGRAIGRRWFS